MEADLRSSKSSQNAGNAWTRVWTSACTWDTAKRLASLALTAIGTACLCRGCRERHTRRVLSLYCVLPLLKARSAELPLQAVMPLTQSGTQRKRYPLMARLSQPPEPEGSRQVRRDLAVVPGLQFASRRRHHCRLHRCSQLDHARQHCLRSEGSEGPTLSMRQRRLELDRNVGCLRPFPICPLPIRSFGIRLPYPRCRRCTIWLCVA